MATKITGYRDLSENEIDIINSIKDQGLRTHRLIEWMVEKEEVDHRWINIARTQLQQGFMALARAVAKPEGF